MADKLIYFPNDETQDIHFFRLQLVVGHSPNETTNQIQ